MALSKLAKGRGRRRQVKTPESRPVAGLAGGRQVKTQEATGRRQHNDYTPQHNHNPNTGQGLRDADAKSRLKSRPVASPRPRTPSQGSRADRSPHTYRRESTEHGTAATANHNARTYAKHIAGRWLARHHVIKQTRTQPTTTNNNKGRSNQNGTATAN